MKAALYALGCIGLAGAVIAALEWSSARRYDHWQENRRRLARQADDAARAARIERVRWLADWTENMPDLWAAFEADYRTRSKTS